MEFRKESSYKPKKHTVGCPQCWRGRYSCSECKGPCIFSKANFEKNGKCIKEFKMKLKDKYYKDDFVTMRNTLLNSEGVKDDPNEQEKIESLDEYELLEMIHTSPKPYYDVFGKHVTEYNARKARKIGVYLSGPKIKGRCWWHRSAYEGKHFDTFGISEKPGSRHVRIGALLKGSEDFIIKNE